VVTRPGKRAIRDAVLEVLRLLPATTPPRDFSHSPGDMPVLPQYPGEMGIEIRYFLARVEPWLRAGWRILSRRPELYPTGAAVFDQDLTDAENALFARFGAVRLATGPKIMWPGDGGVRYLREHVARAKAQRLQREWRQLLRPYLSASLERPWTRWDQDLTTVSTAFHIHQMWRAGDVVPPSYLPPAYVSTGTEDRHPDHVGVQLRRVAFNVDGRDSDAGSVMGQAEAVARRLSLPLLVYGDPAGCILPPAQVTTSSLGDGRLLQRELGYLRTCRLMLAPNSGWADLMCWLRVPVLVECTEPLWIYDMMAPFRPRLLFRDPRTQVEDQADALIAGATHVDLGVGTVTEPTVRAWMAGGC
jgi:hypothetical protein